MITLKRKIQIFMNNKNQIFFIDKSNNKQIKEYSFNRYIKYLSSQKILNLYDNEKNNNVVLEYKDYSVEIFDYLKIFSLDMFKTVLYNIKKYEESKKIRSVNRKKITRVNKYNKNTVAMLSGISLVIVMASTLLQSYTNFDNIEIKNNNNLEAASYYNVLETESGKLNNKFAVLGDEINNVNNDNSDDVSSIEPKEEINLESFDKVESVSLNYNDLSFNDIVKITSEKYGAIIQKYSKMYGIDPKLMLAISLVESTGNHDPVKNSGGATGLMQIQNEAFENKSIRAYNFESNCYEELYIDAEKISDLEYNIKIACMLMQNNLQYTDYNIIMAIQSYNMGYGSIMDILKVYSANCNVKIDDIKQNINDVDWLDYRYVIHPGNNYVERVFSWLGTDVQINCIKPNGENVSISVNNGINKVY